MIELTVCMYTQAFTLFSQVGLPLYQNKIMHARKKAFLRQGSRSEARGRKVSAAVRNICLPTAAWCGVPSIPLSWSARYGTAAL